MSSFYLCLLRVALLLPAVAIASKHQDHKTICELLSDKLPGLVSSPDKKAYNASQTSYYTSQERNLIPACVFTPNNTKQVSEFVKVIVSAGNGTSAPQFAIRGGGHALWTGAANIDGGVTIDMRSLNSFALNEDKTVAAVGGGAIWSHIYPLLVPHNLTVMGGRVPGIGVGGFTTGGGINFLARRHGWDCDNVYGYEVVLANGDIVYATAATHSDLWLALKGGSNNFGIITRFDLATFPQGLMWGGVIAFNYTQSSLDAQAAAFSSFMDTANFDDAADMGLVLGYAGGSYFVEDTLFYVDPVLNPPVYENFTSIPSLAPNSLGLSDVSTLVLSFGGNLPSVLNRATELVYCFKNSDASLYSQLFSIWETSSKSLLSIKGLELQLLIQPLPVTNGTNSLGVTPGQKDLVMTVVTIAWDDAADDDFAQSSLADVVAKQEQLVRDKGLYVDFKYLNYADISQDPIGSYGAKNKKFLQAVSRKYDPKGVFQTVVPGGFKLFV